MRYGIGRVSTRETRLNEPEWQRPWFDSSQAKRKSDDTIARRRSRNATINKINLLAQKINAQIHRYY